MIVQTYEAYFQQCSQSTCMVRPFKMAILLLSLHLLLDQDLLHSYGYPVLLSMGLNESQVTDVPI